ncbi:fermitin family homolog 3-like [Leptosomus discolor]
MAGLKTASGEAIDGSFELQVEVEVGDAVGQPGPTAPPGCPPAAPRALALRVTGDLHVGGLMRLIAESVGERRDWSDHALWWSQRRRWLLRAGSSLDALGVGADARLRFAPRHRPLRLLLPNGRRLRLRLCFAGPAAGAVGQACRLLESMGGVRGVTRGGRVPGAPPPPAPRLPPDSRGPAGGDGARRPPPPPPREPPAASRAPARTDVADDAELLLRFKYPCALELDPQRDGLRLALLVEQGRGALLAEELDCTEEETLLFAALQYHIDEVGGSEELGGPGGGDDLDDLDTALSNLEVKLGGEAELPEPLEEVPTVPELAEELEIYRYPRGVGGGPRRLTLRGFRPAWATLKGTALAYGRSPPAPGEPLTQLNLRGCEVTPDVDVGAQKFCIKLLVVAPDGMSEIHLRCRDAPQYARWVAGCRLASRGRSLAGASLGAEARGVLGRKGKAKQLVPRILEVLHRLGALSPTQARLRFLEAWRALPGFGLAYFLVRFQGSRRDEVLAVGPSRLLRLEPGTGSVTRAWRHSALRQWNINWDTQQALHEFLGGYLCLGGRQPGQPLDLRLFRKLTGGQEPL